MDHAFVVAPTWLRQRPLRLRRALILPVSRTRCVLPKRRRLADHPTFMRLASTLELV
jgi:hypothetical protein